MSLQATLVAIERELGKPVRSADAPWRTTLVGKPPLPKRREKGVAAEENAFAYFRKLIAGEYQKFDNLITALSLYRNKPLTINSGRGMISREAAKPTDPKPEQ